VQHRALSWFRLPPATKSTTRPPLPLPACGGEWKEKGRNQWVGIRAVQQNSKQRETGTTMIQIRRKHNNEPHDPDSCSPGRDRRRAPPQSRERVPAALPPRTGTPRDVPWYGIPVSVWPGGVSPHPPGCAPSWSPVKINAVLAKPRTGTQGPGPSAPFRAGVQLTDSEFSSTPPFTSYPAVLERKMYSHEGEKINVPSSSVTQLLPRVFTQMSWCLGILNDVFLQVSSP